MNSLKNGRSYFNFATDVLHTPVGLVVLFGYTWSLIHHALGGIRHFIWDTGRGFTLGTVNALSWATIIGSMLITAGLWALVYQLRGGL